MAKYTVVIEETLVQEFSVEAKSLEEAKQISREKYQNGEFVVDNGECQSTHMQLITQDGLQDDWEVIQ